MAKAGEKDTDKIVSEMIKLIETEPMAKIDYVQAVDAVSVKPVKGDDSTSTSCHGSLYRQNQID